MITIAAVVDGNEISDAHVSRLTIDLDDGDVTAEGERAGLFEIECVHQRALPLAGGDGQLGPAAPGRRHTSDTDATLVEHDDVVDGRLEEVSGEGPRLQQHLL